MNDKKKELISNYLDGELNAEDTRTAEILITQDLEVSKMYEEIKSVDTLIETLPELTPTEEMRFSFKQKLMLQRFRNTKERKLQKALTFSTRFAFVASILLLITLVAFILVKTFNNNEVSDLDKHNLVNEDEGKGDKTPKIVSNITDEIKPDEDMFEYMDLLNSVYDFEDLTLIDESVFEGLEKNVDLVLVEAALTRNYANLDNSGND